MPEGGPKNTNIERQRADYIRLAILDQFRKITGNAVAIEAASIQARLCEAYELGTVGTIDPEGNLRIGIAATYAMLQKEGEVRPIIEIIQEAQLMTENSGKVM